ncbi:MAG: hypothetical protein AB7F75_04510 [Planctomycetota bacterium]
MPIDPKTAQWADAEIRKNNLPAAAEKLQMGLMACPDDAAARKKLRMVARKNRVNNPITGMAKMGFMAKITKMKTVLMTKKDPKEYMVEAEKVLFEDPNNVDILLQMAEYAAQLGYMETSKWVLEDLTTLDENNASIWKSLGKLHHRQLKNFEEAKKCYSRVLKANPQDIETTKWIREIEADQTMGTGSISARSNLKDESATLRRELENRVIRGSDDAKAHVKYLMEDLEKDPKNTKIMEKIADRYRQGEMYKESIEMLEKALALEPSNNTLRMRIGDIKLQRVTNQIQKIEAALLKDPNNADYKAKLAKARQLEQQAGIETFCERCNAFPSDLSLKFSYGEYLFKAEQYKEALSQFQKAIADPKVADFANEKLAECFMKLEKPKMAVKPIEFCLSKAIAQSDRWKSLMYLWGQALRQMGEEAGAKEKFEKIYEVDISFKDVADLI